MELFEDTRRIVSQVLASELALRGPAHERLRHEGGPWFAIGRMRLELSFGVVAEAQSLRFLVKRRRRQSEIADVRLHVEVAPSRAPVAVEVGDPVLVSRVMEFAHLTKDEDRLDIITSAGKLRARFDDEGRVQLALGGGYRRWFRASWVFALLRTVGAWADGEGTTRTRRFDPDDTLDQQVVAVVARGVHALADEFVGTEGLGTIDDWHWSRLGPERALGRHYRLLVAKAEVSGLLGRDGRFVAPGSVGSGQRIELSVEALPRANGWHVHLERGMAGLVTGPAKARVTVELDRHADRLRSRFRAALGVGMLEQELARFVDRALRNNLVIVRLDDRGSMLALLHGSWETRSAVALFRLRTTGGPDEPSLVPDSIECIAGRWGGQPKRWDRWIKPDETVHAYVSLLIRSMYGWVLS